MAQPRLKDTSPDTTTNSPQSTVFCPHPVDSRRFQAQERCMRRWLAKNMRMCVLLGASLALGGFALLLLRWPKAPLSVQAMIAQLGTSPREVASATGKTAWAWTTQPFWRADTLSLWGITALICALQPLYVMLLGHFIKRKDPLASALVLAQMALVVLAVWFAEH